MTDVLKHMQGLQSRELVIVPIEAVYRYDLHGFTPVPVEEFRAEVAAQTLKEQYVRAKEAAKGLKEFLGETEDADVPAAQPFEFVAGFLKMAMKDD